MIDDIFMKGKAKETTCKQDTMLHNTREWTGGFRRLLTIIYFPFGPVNDRKDLVLFAVQLPANPATPA